MADLPAPGLPGSSPLPEALELREAAEGGEVGVGLEQVPAVPPAHGPVEVVEGLAPVLGGEGRGLGVDAGGPVQRGRAPVGAEALLGVGVGLLALAQPGQE